MGDFNKHLVIIGSARSGTSWVAETMAKKERYRLLFEPEHEFNTRDGKLICDRLLERDNNYPAAANYFIKIFRNKIDNDWIAQNSNRKFKMHLWPVIPKRYIIKLVRGNLSADLLSNYFKIPLLYIVRNPYDVIYSQHRVQFNWLYDLDIFKSQIHLTDHLKSRFGIDLNSDSSYSKIEKLAIRWCIENSIIHQYELINNKDFRMVKYEDLKKDINLFYDICKQFNLGVASDLEKNYSKPSTKTHPNSVIRKNRSIESFNQKDLKDINRILDIFRIDLYPRQTN